MINEENYADIEVDQPLDEFEDSEGQVDYTDEEAVESEWDEDDYPEYLDLDEYGSKTVVIKVDGEMVEVPLSEALAGYQRQSDYTRKTQELSKQKQDVQTASALAEALARDPQGTLNLLQQHYGVGQHDIQASYEEDMWVDPLAKELEEIKAWKRDLEYKQTLSEVENEIIALERKYGEDFNREEVIVKALASGSQNLEETFKLIQFDRVYSERGEATRKVAQTSQRTQAKKSAQVVSGGSSSRGDAVVPTQSKSVLEAFLAAEKQLGL
jgi:hypothetical protein